MAEAHKTQTRLIQDEINGEKVDTSLLMIHAQRSSYDSIE